MSQSPQQRLGCLHIGKTPLARFAPSFLVASAALAIVGGTMVSSVAQQQFCSISPGARTTPPTGGYPTYALAAGMQIVQWVDGAGNMRASLGNASLADGQYQLANGGAIVVRHGRIVWDAFGALERFRATGCVNPAG
jgi:hypothetical protein